MASSDVPPEAVQGEEFIAEPTIGDCSRIISVAAPIEKVVFQAAKSVDDAIVKEQASEKDEPSHVDDADNSKSVQGEEFIAEPTIGDCSRIISVAAPIEKVVFQAAKSVDDAIVKEQASEKDEPSHVDDADNSKSVQGEEFIAEPTIGDCSRIISVAAPIEKVVFQAAKSVDDAIVKEQASEKDEPSHVDDADNSKSVQGEEFIAEPTIGDCSRIISVAAPIEKVVFQAAKSVDDAIVKEQASEKDEPSHVDEADKAKVEGTFIHSQNKLLAADFDEIWIEYYSSRDFTKSSTVVFQIIPQLASFSPLNLLGLSSNVLMYNTETSCKKLGINCHPDSLKMCCIKHKKELRVTMGLEKKYRSVATLCYCHQVRATVVRKGFCIVKRRKYEHSAMIPTNIIISRIYKTIANGRAFEYGPVVAFDLNDFKKQKDYKELNCHFRACPYKESYVEIVDTVLEVSEDCKCQVSSQLIPRRGFYDT